MVFGATFDHGDARDLSGNASSQTVSGATLIGSHYDFDGVNDFIVTQYITNPALSHTFIVRCKPDDVTTWQDIISTDNGSYDWGVQVQAGTWRVTNGYNFINTGVTATTTETHLALVCEVGVSMRLYVNGALAFTTAITGNTNNYFTMGKDADGTRYFNGKIYESLIFQGVLSALEIGAHYELEKAA